MKDGNIFRNLLFFLSFITLTASAMQVDTTFSGDGGPGPYPIGIWCPDSATLNVSLPDSIGKIPWTLIADRNALLFSQPIDSGVPVKVRFKTLYYGVPKIYSLFTKSYVNRNDSAARLDSARLALFAPPREENLSVSGYKSVGVSVGSFGQVNLEQGLDVRIGGEIRPQTTVSAHLSDQGSSLDGATREISDFDMIYIGLDNPSYHAVAGDQYVAWPMKGLLSGQKKIKGLSGSYAPLSTPLSFGAFGALSGGNAAIETKQGQTGKQGPYYLTGKGEKDFIQPVSGTVKVRINGRTLEEGAEKDFIVDYGLGTVTFTPRVPIKDEDLIRLEYEYKTFNYQRTLLGATAGFAGRDSFFTIRGALWSESDNKDHPIDLVLTNAEIDSLRAAGDRLPYASTARAVHPNDVARESELYALYRQRYDPVANSNYFEFVPDSVIRKTPDSALGYYNVWFRRVNTGEKGMYRVAFTDQRGPVYTYAGKDSGDYTDLSPVPAPERRTQGEMVGALKLKYLTATVDIAGQDHDRNLFSSLDEKDNQASATNFSFLAGLKRSDRASAWIGGSHRFTSTRFDAEGLSAYDRKEQWDDTRLAETQVERQLWDASAGATILPGLQAAVGYGQNRVASNLVTDKISPSARYSRGDRFSAGYDGSFFRHVAEIDKGDGRRESADARLAFTRHIVTLLYRDEWRNDSSGRGSGLYEGGAQYDFTPLHLHEEATYQSRRKSGGSNILGSIDTGFSLRWAQAFDKALLPAWKLNASSSFDRTVNYGASRTSTLLIELTSDVTPKSIGFSTRQHYRTSAEQASAFIQIPVFAGKGMGTHVYDSIRKEYVPHTPGDYYLQQQEVYDQGSSERVRKTVGDISWAFKPQQRLRGILDDLSWDGTLSCEEHVDAATLTPSSWAPGYLSLAGLEGNGSAATAVRYADLSYRQDINWLPRADSGAVDRPSGRLAVTPAYRNIRSYRERSIDSRLETERPIRRFTVGGALNLLALKHTDTTGASDMNYSIVDRRFEFSQKYRIGEKFRLTLLEAAGIAQKSTAGSQATAPLDSMFYYQIVPGLIWQPGAKGSLQATYTYSVVPLSGDIDFRMARGFQGGISHQANISSDIKIGERLMILGTYRGDLHKAIGAAAFEKPNHVFSLEVRAFM
jgi:hypothetical protein